MIVRGKVTSTSDVLDAGRVYVELPTLNVGVWAYNRLSTYNYNTVYDSSNRPISAGQFFPIINGSNVLVEFPDEKDVTDNKGFVIRIVSHDAFSIPFINNTNTKSEDMYLLMETKNSSALYFDESRRIIHLTQSAGNSNLFLTDTTIDLNVPTKTKNDKGEIVLGFGSKIEITDTSITLNVKNKGFVRVSEDGVSFGVQGENTFNVTPKDFEIRAENIYLSAVKEIHLKADKILGTGFSNLEMISNETRLSGNQTITVNGNVAVVDGFTEATIKGLSTRVGSFSTINTSIMGTIMQIEALANMFIMSPLCTVSGAMFNVVSGCFSMGSPAIFMDGLSVSNLGIGATIAGAMSGVNFGISATAKTLGVISVTATTLSDPISPAIFGVI
jgi:hypothetical protein